MNLLLVYGLICLIYHFMEFFLIGIIHGKSSVRSLLIGIPYIMAQIFLLMEFLILGEKFSLPYLGLVGMCIGLSLRWTAILQAGKSFTHELRTEKEPNHQLITSGVYGFFRHPSYLGWYIFSLSAPVFLGSPFSLLGFSILGWYYFRARIKEEEKYLIQLFGESYQIYKDKTSSGIPFIA
ncbi:methyltransferase family protein [Pleomorphovibrio marinus]|uniref:methyltransferase family protein n=1 Tax=Pleomorphovibrio marinus TaxID=2164132 RepID=UPI000E0C0686|nr:isoprenylcysteine carboxylmethyltransferase family protein [Pleomorphovibrio marinus]